MNITMYQIDAFTDTTFGGNPAAVCVLDKMLPLETMQKIAAENYVPETAFFAKEDDRYHIKWFTPEVEMDLCGHATLATAFVILNHIEPNTTSVQFNSLSGPLSVTTNKDMLYLDFPSRMPTPEDIDPRLEAIFGYKPKSTHKSRDLLVEFESEEQIRHMTPDFNLMNTITEYFAYIVTAPGNDCDFVSRFFAPGLGINEDPVTGSAHSTLIPYWASKLGKNKLSAQQLSHRHGTLECEHQNDRVSIGGKCVQYLKGEIEI